ncbi:hypothetical protein ALC57_12743 [Trachymyrmex cornetzi]|uniref:CCHC-type domain-containing protein n=1 Tax=Trachymyrmex cornetzi TaxID=471704 RepID=A0A151J0P8_9HYME|nr:hypothetical protein ALC57_12743 [Trachymyrmex cornetzi]
MHKINKDGKIELVPSKSMCVKFAGQVLPKHVSLFHTLHAVPVFIPKVRICYNCFRVGHIRKACRSNARCIHYGDSPHNNPQDCNLREIPHKCINCNGNHLPASNDCMLVIKQKKIVALAAQENIPLLARKRVSSELLSSDRDIKFDYNNFPSLSKQDDSSHFYNFTNNNRFSLLQSNPSQHVIDNDHSYANAANPPRRSHIPFGGASLAPSRSKSSPLSHPQARPTPHSLDTAARDDLLFFRNGRSPSYTPSNGVALSHSANLHNGPSEHTNSYPSINPSPPHTITSSSPPSTISDLSHFIQLLISVFKLISSLPFVSELLSNVTLNSILGQIHS